MSHSKKKYEKMLQDIIEEARMWDVLSKAAVCVATFRTWRSQILCTTTAPRARDTCSCCIGSTTGFLLALTAHINWATRGRGRSRLADISRWWHSEMEGALCKNSWTFALPHPAWLHPALLATFSHACCTWLLCASSMSGTLQHQDGPTGLPSRLTAVR